MAKEVADAETGTVTRRQRQTMEAEKKQMKEVKETGRGRGSKYNRGNKEASKGRGNEYNRGSRNEYNRGSYLEEETNIKEKDRGRTLITGRATEAVEAEPRLLLQRSSCYSENLLHSRVLHIT